MSFHFPENNSVWKQTLNYAVYQIHTYLLFHCISHHSPHTHQTCNLLIAWDCIQLTYHVTVQLHTVDLSYLVCTQCTGSRQYNVMFYIYASIYCVSSLYLSCSASMTPFLSITMCWCLSMIHNMTCHKEQRLRCIWNSCHFRSIMPGTLISFNRRPNKFIFCLFWKHLPTSNFFYFFQVFWGFFQYSGFSIQLQFLDYPKIVV